MIKKSVITTIFIITMLLIVPLKTTTIKGSEGSSNSNTQESTLCNCGSSDYTNTDPIILKQDTQTDDVKISELNEAIKKKGAKWIAGENPIYLLSDQEKDKLCGLIDPFLEESLMTSTNEGESGSPLTTSSSGSTPSTGSANYPKYFDWRNKNGKNYMTSVKSQGDCGSCWAFATVGCVEGFINAFYNNPNIDVNLAEQDLVSCSGAGSCSGGSYGPALAYIRDNGIAIESCFPYTHSNDNCANKCDNWQEDAWSIENYGYIDYPKIDEVKDAIMNHGPICSGMRVYDEFHSYNGGIYQVVDDSDEPGLHAIVLLGFGEENGVSYWIGKNSWGTGWGEDGYFRIKMGECGIASGFAYVNGTPIPPEEIQVECTDNDNDGYYYWGIGPKPDYCPPCPDIPDCNDNDYNIHMRCGYGYTGDPYFPNNPKPINQLVSVDIDTIISWTGGDPDNFISENPSRNNTVEYDIYLGTDTNPAYNTTIGPYPGWEFEIEYQLQNLEYHTNYYWKIVSRDSEGGISEGPIWCFRTKAEEELGEHFTGEGYQIYSGYHTDKFNDEDGYYWSQSFIASHNYLTSIDLYLKKEGYPYSTFDIYILDNSYGEPSFDNTIASASVSYDKISESYSWVYFDIIDISVITGETYYIVTNAKATTTYHNYIIGAVWNSDYSNGMLWKYFPENTPKWSSSENADLIFKTYGYNYEEGVDIEQIKFSETLFLSSYNKIAQSFIPNNDNLDSISLLIENAGATKDLNLYIKDNLEGTVLTSISIPSSQIFGPIDYYIFDFPNVDVNSGQTYYIVLTTTSGGGSVSSYNIGIGNENPYDDGMAYKTNKIGSWDPFNDQDFWFKTYSIDNGPETYTITASAGPGGNINPSGSIPVNYGEDKTITITPDTGYHILDVLVDGVSQGAISSYTFTNVIADHTITASFAINQYELKINIEGQGTTNPGEGIHTYEEGYSVRITAIPDTGYLFSHWSGDITGSDNPETIIMESDKTVTAHFIPENEEHILTISTIGNGTVNKNPDQTTYTHGTIVTLTATPDDNNNIFHHWSGDLTGYQDTITITMDSDKEVTANFTLRGDVNCDGRVGAADITYVQEIMFGNLDDIPAADVNQDGNINIEDIQTIEKIFLGYTLI